MGKLIVLLYSFIVGLGTYDPIFGVDASFGIVEINICFLMLIFILNIKKCYHFIKPFFYLPILIGILLFISSLIYDIQIEHIFNIKYIFAVTSFFLIITLSRQFNIGIEQILFAFMLGTLVLLVLSQAGVIEYEAGVRGRWDLGGENSNYTSSRFSLALIYCVFVVFSKNKKLYTKLLMVPISLSLLVFIINSGSRGSLLIVVFIICFFTINKYRLKSIPILLIIGAIAFYLFADMFMESAMRERLLVSAEEGSIGARESIWIEVLEIAKNNLLFGVGEAGFKKEITRGLGFFIDAHNMYLYILVCGGIVSLAIMLLFHYKLLKISYFSMRRDNNIIPLCLLLFVVMLAAKTGGALYSKNIWFYFALVYLSTFYYEKDSTIPLVENRKK